MNTLLDLAQTTGGRILPANRIRVAGEIALGRIVSDSRQVQAGDVFWALQGANYQGECYVNEAYRRGAQGAISARIEELPDDCWVLQVDDTQRALAQWAGWKRRKSTGIVIGVTGNVGKTATRQMIHTVLQSRLKGTASPRNHNSLWGVPLSVLAIEPQHDYAVLELAAGKPGEIAALAEMSAPKVGVITESVDSHSGGGAPAQWVGSRQGVAEARTELLAALPASGQAVLADDPWLRAQASRCAAPITWIGTGPQCDLRAIDVQSAGGRLEFHVVCGNRIQPAADSRGKKPLRFSVPVWGRHHIPAALSAIAVARMMGFDMDEIAAALAKYEAASTRCEVVEIRGATVIKAAHNSSPDAMRAALELLRDFDVAGRRIVICGDAAELGPRSIALHWQLGKDIVEIGGAELVIACGQFARHVTAGARSTGLVRSRAVPCDTVEEAMPYVGQAVLPGDVVLVEGSRVMAIDRVIDALRHFPRRRSA
jgi:UDP-N-acetylmuramoyl-tripeptide--D-alanyl-D-alanine ligase